MTDATAGHNGSVTDAEQTPSTPAPSPQLFARPAAPATESQRGAGDSAGEPTLTAVDDRFASTGDVRVDQVIAQLPHPEEQATTDGALPDPELLDGHIADITSVHRQLQQRLSDLSG